MGEKILILGLGNVLMGDEGVGVKSIEYLHENLHAEGVRLLDGGTGGFHLLSLFQEHEKFIIIDATFGTEKPGEVTVLKPRFASDFPRSLTSHDIGLRDLMQSAELLEELPEIYLVTVNINEFNSVRIGLSEEIEKSFSKILSAVEDILKRIQ